MTSKTAVKSAFPDNRGGLCVPTVCTGTGRLSSSRFAPMVNDFNHSANRTHSSQSNIPRSQIRRCNPWSSSQPHRRQPMLGMAALRQLRSVPPPREKSQTASPSARPFMPSLPAITVGQRDDAMGCGSRHGPGTISSVPFRVTLRPHRAGAACPVYPR